MADTVQFRRWLLPSLLMVLAILADRLLGGGLIWGWLGGVVAVVLHPDSVSVANRLQGTTNG